MIQSFLFCNGYGRGYREIYADYENNELRYPVKGEMPSIVTKIWNHTGTSAIGGFCDNKYYFIVKDIEILRDKMMHDDQGRKICMNLAFVSDEESKPDFTLFIRGFMINYIAATKGFAEAFTFASNIAGYELDFEIWNDVIKKCITFGDSINNVIKKIELNNRNKIQFLFLKYELADFRTQTEISDPIGRIFSADEYKKIVDESIKEFPVSDNSTDEHFDNTVLEVETEKNNDKESAYCDSLKEEISEKMNLIESINTELKSERAKSEDYRIKIAEEHNNVNLLKEELATVEKSKKGLLAACLVLSAFVVSLIIYIIFFSK